MTKSEKKLLSQLTLFKSQIIELEKKINDEKEEISINSKHVEKLRKLSNTIREKVEKEKSTFKPLSELHDKHKKEITELQNKVLKCWNLLILRFKSLKTIKVSNKRIWLMPIPTC